MVVIVEESSDSDADGEAAVLTAPLAATAEQAHQEDVDEVDDDGQRAEGTGTGATVEEMIEKERTEHESARDDFYKRQVHFFGGSDEVGAALAFPPYPHPTTEVCGGGCVCVRRTHGRWEPAPNRSPSQLRESPGGPVRAVNVTCTHGWVARGCVGDNFTNAAVGTPAAPPASSDAAALLAGGWLTRSARPDPASGSTPHRFERSA